MSVLRQRLRTEMASFLPLGGAKPAISQAAGKLPRALSQWLELPPAKCAEQGELMEVFHLPLILASSL